MLSHTSCVQCGSFSFNTVMHTGLSFHHTSLREKELWAPCPTQKQTNRWINKQTNSCVVFPPWWGLSASLITDRSTQNSLTLLEFHRFHNLSSMSANYSRKKNKPYKKLVSLCKIEFQHSGHLNICSTSSL